MQIINIENRSNDNMSISGTSLMGYVKTDYNSLIECFGEPILERGDKTNCEWHIEFTVVDEYGDEVMIPATIYDWKLDETPYHTYNWHIGGFNMSAVDLVNEALNRQQGDAKDDVAMPFPEEVA